MRRPLHSRLLALFLAVALMVPMFPSAYAEEEATDPTVSTEVSEPAEETEAPSEETEAPSEETEAPSEETEAPSEETEAPSEETEAPTDETEAPTDETEATDPSEEPQDPTEETEDPDAEEEEEDEKAEYSFQGLPEDYILPEDNAEKLAAMDENDVYETMLELVPGVGYADNQIMVSARDEEEARLFAEAFNGVLVDYYEGLCLIVLTDSTPLEAVAASLDAAYNLPVATPNHLFRTIPIYDQPLNNIALEAPSRQTWADWVQNNMTNPDPYLEEPSGSYYQWHHDVVDTYAGWGVSTGSSDVTVGIIDSGVDTAHADLNVTSYDVGLGTSDVAGHGTHVAGLIGATMNNGKGGAGIAPNVKMVSYCVGYSDGSIDTYYMIKAMKHAATYCDVINMSLGSPLYNPDVKAAVDDCLAQNCAIIAAMGNDGSNTMNYPACYDGVIGVAATTKSGNRAYFSNYGKWVDVSAPGYQILSTVPGSYGFMSGTSMATPIVTGVAALYLSWFGSMTPAQLENALEKGCEKCPDKEMGAGIVNLAKMLGGKPAAPAYLIESEDGAAFANYGTYTEYKSQVLLCESKLYLGTFGIDETEYILYTLDGKTPSVKNGQVSVGQLYDFHGSGIDLSQFAGSTVTVKAMQVSGMGVAGKVLSLKLKVADSIKVDSITITAPKVVVAGKSVELKAVVNPADRADQGVIWSVLPNEMRVTITAKGKLIVPATARGMVTVRCESSADRSVYEEVDISIQQILPVTKMALDYTKTTLWVGQTFDLEIATMTDKNGDFVDPSISGVLWTSSNTKVATVDQNGLVTAVGKGSATISCKSLDGSNKTAKCTITVKQQTTSVTITGSAQVAPGGSATYKAVQAPANVSTKGVIWSIVSAPSGVTISSSGSLKVSKTVSVDSSITIRATAKDGMGASATYTITVQPKVTKITLDASYDGYADGITYSKGLPKTAGIFSVDLNETYGADNQVRLYANIFGPDACPVEWTTNKASVATVDQNGLVTGHAAGTATITCKALDGSNKKATITVKVTNPVSSLWIDTSAKQMTNGYPYVAFGKSATNKVVFTDTYGKPSNTKVTWELKVYEVDVNSSGNLTVLDDLTDYCVSNKLVTLSSSGKLTTKKGLRDLWENLDGELYAEIVAYPTDGTEYLDGNYGLEGYFLIPPTGFIRTSFKTVNANVGDYGTVEFNSNQWGIFGSSYNTGFVAYSSNPEVCSTVEIAPYRPVGGWECQYYLYLACNKAGTAKITIEAADGSGVKHSFTVKVSP